MNISQLFNNQSLLKTVSNGCGYPCMTPQHCAKRCLAESVRFHYEFVWFFVLAFLFNEMKIIPYYVRDWDIKTQNRYSRGFSVASYVLNLAGILYFLVVVL